MKTLQVLLLSFGLLAPGAIAANIVLNPGFENLTGVTPDNWTLSGWGIDFTPGQQHSGDHYIYTGCVGASCIDLADGAFFYQDLPTTIGQTYDLSFYAAFAGTPNEIKVFWGGTTAIDVVNGGNIIPTYNLFTATNLLATSTTTRLAFTGRQDPAWNGVDDVSVDVSGVGAVPEPSSILLIGGGLLALGLRRRLR